MIQSRSYITRKILRQSDEILIPGLEPFIRLNGICHRPESVLRNDK